MYVSIYISGLLTFKLAYELKLNIEGPPLDKQKIFKDIKAGKEMVIPSIICHELIFIIRLSWSLLPL